MKDLEAWQQKLILLGVLILVVIFAIMCSPDPLLTS